MDITVVGAGVIGLTTAQVLEQHGHRVTIVAAAQRGGTTSAIAGAVWFPYRVGPPVKVALWAARTRDWLTEIAASTPEAGVDVLTGYEIALTDELPWWSVGIELKRVPAPMTGAPMAWQFSAPRCEPALFLPWLEGQLRATITRKVVSDLGAEPGDVVVNCTGLGARALCNDEALVPLLGQVAIAEPGSYDLATTVTDDRAADEIFYVIPRRGELVVGGISRLVPHGIVPQVDPAITHRVLAQARELGVAIGAVREVRTGLRPFRPEVRLERDAANPRIIHNYGHGGAGFTLCRGCAEQVASIVEG